MRPPSWWYVSIVGNSKVLMCITCYWSMFHLDGYMRLMMSYVDVSTKVCRMTSKYN